jgi:hypothetical protein
MAAVDHRVGTVLALHWLVRLIAKLESKQLLTAAEREELARSAVDSMGENRPEAVILMKQIYPNLQLS